MDELLYLNLLEEIEEAEIDVEDLQIIERHVGDPFTQLSNSMFAQIFRLSKELCLFLINSLEPYMRPAVRPTDLDNSLKVLVALRFFATGSYQMDVGSNYFLNVSQASVSRSIREVTEALNHPDIFNAWVKFPNNFEELNAVRRRFFEEHNIPGVIGCIDCTHVAIFPPKINDPEYPEYVYVNRKGYHSINVQLVCDSALKIMNVSARYPGSTNDAFVWNNSNLQILLRRLHMAGYKDYYLLGDSGYPLRTWLFTPLEEEPEPNSPDYRYNTTHKRTRCIIERCNGVLKMRFRCLLKHRVLHYAPQMACKIINACIVLHNLCIEHGMPEVEEDNDEFDFGILPNVQNDNLNEHIQRRSPLEYSNGADLFFSSKSPITERIGTTLRIFMSLPNTHMISKRSNFVRFAHDVTRDVEETQADFSEVFPDCEIEEEKSGDFYNTPASPITVPYCPRPPSTGSQKSPRSRRQRTTSLNQSSKKTAAESIIRTQHRTIYTAGRPPWYNSEGQKVEPFVIGICGGSASGKTTVAEKIIESLGVPWVTLLSMDSFYKVLNEKQHEIADRNEYNFDHPDAFDFDLLISTLQRLKEGRKVEVPIYNFVTHSRETRTKTMYGANVIIFEGILTFHNTKVNEMLDMKIFVDTDADVRLARRLRRDISQRGRDLDGVLKQYTSMVQPSFNHYIAPLMSHADIIVPRGGENEVAIQLIVQHVQTQLQLRGLKLREELAQAYAINKQPRPDTVKLLPTTPQIRGLHTFIRNKDTPRDEFIFYSKRLIRLVIEYTLSLMTFVDKTIETPQGVLYYGKRMATGNICGVSILRAGETMEQAVCDVCKDIRIGKILIQTNLQTGEPELYYLRLPKDIKDYKVILMDATVATGAAAMMAIRVLLDHDVLESNILIVSLLMAESGVQSIAYAFPKVQIVTTAIDPEINDKFYVLPGIGNFGDRYFGTEPSEY